MNRSGICLALAASALALAACKGKSSSGGADDAGATAASASAPAASASAPPPASSAPLPAALATLMGFEGEIDMVATSADSNKPPQPINMWVKGDRLRFDVIPGTSSASILGGNAFLLLRGADKKLDVVAETHKQAIELDLTNPDALKNIQKAGGAPAKPNAKPEPPPKLTKTGTKETLAGYPCEDWDVVGSKDKKEVSACVAALPSTFFHIPLVGLPNEYGFATELVDGQHFPLKVIGYDERTGSESGRLEVTKIEAHPVDAAKFEIPAGYQTIDMVQMVQGLVSHLPGAMPSGLPGNIPMPPQHGRHPPRH